MVTRTGKLAGLVLTVALSLTACGSDNNSTGPSPRQYNQVQRLGNPLVSEVFPREEGPRIPRLRRTGG